MLTDGRGPEPPICKVRAISMVDHSGGVFSSPARTPHISMLHNVSDPAVAKGSQRDIQDGPCEGLLCLERMRRWTKETLRLSGSGMELGELRIRFVWLCARGDFP